jgi:hypothetical protein
MTHHLTLDNTYDRPEIIRGVNVSRVSGALCRYQMADSLETIADVTLVPNTTDPATYRVTHDGCDSGQLTLVDATLIGSPTYNTYSTVFAASATAGTIRAKLVGYRVDVIRTDLVKTYPVARGENHSFECSIASDATITEAMFDRYQSITGATKYQIKMRDNPAVEVGDVVLLDTVESPAGISVTVEEIKRTFNGGIDGEYILVDAGLEPYPVAEMATDSDTAVQTADGAQTVGGANVATLTLTAIGTFHVGDY